METYCIRPRRIAIIPARPDAQALFVKHRHLTDEELTRLTEEYNDHFNTDDGHHVTLIGGEDVAALKLGIGDEYARLVYSATHDRFDWHYATVEGEDEPEHEDGNWSWRDDQGDHDR